MKSKTFSIKNIGTVTVKREFDEGPNESGCHYVIVFHFSYKNVPVSFYFPYDNETKQSAIFDNLTHEEVENTVNNFILIQLGD